MHSLAQTGVKRMRLLPTGINRNHHGRMNHLVTTDVETDNMRPPDDEGDWDARYSQQAESHANLIWDMPLSKIYETCSDNRVSMWCEWIQEAVFTQWLEDQGSE